MLKPDMSQLLLRTKINRANAQHSERTLIQLRELQKIRLANRKEDLDSLVDILEMYEIKGETCDPTEDGFVFTDQQIDDAIRARKREN